MLFKIFWLMIGMIKFLNPPSKKSQKGAAVFELASAFGLAFCWFLPNLHESFCKWGKIGPSFRCWNTRTQILLLPCLLNHPKMPPFDPFVKKYIKGHFSKTIFLWGGNNDVYNTPTHPFSCFFHGKRTKKRMLIKHHKEAILRRLMRVFTLKYLK